MSCFQCTMNLLYLIMRPIIYTLLSALTFSIALQGCSKGADSTSSSKKTVAAIAGIYAGITHYTENDAGPDSTGHVKITNVDTSFADTIKIDGSGDVLIIHYKWYNPDFSYFAVVDTFKYDSSGSYYHHYYDADYDMFNLKSADSLYGVRHTYGGANGYYNSHDNAFSGKKLP